MTNWAIDCVLSANNNFT